MALFFYIHTSMGKLVFCLNVWNESVLLPECLDSIRRYAPDAEIVAVDGAYQSFIEEAKVLAAENFNAGHYSLADELLNRFTTPASTDGTLEILQRYGVNAIVAAPEGRAWANEWEKRSQYLPYGKDGDWQFVIDADERLTGNAPTVQVLEAGGSPYYHVTLQRDDGIGAYPVFRIHRWKAGMKYDKAHYALWVDGQYVKRSDYIAHVVQGCQLWHRWSYRGQMDPVRHQVKGAFYRRIQDFDEKSFRDSYEM